MCVRVGWCGEVYLCLRTRESLHSHTPSPSLFLRYVSSSFFFFFVVCSIFQNKLEDGKYGSPGDFSKDMRLIWKNAMTYNRPDSDIFETAEKLAKLFEKKFAKIKTGKKVGKEEGSSEKEALNREVTRNDRLKFSTMVSSLTSEQLGSLVQMIQKECPEAINDDDEEELEIEINNLDQATLHQLNAFCAQCQESKGGELKKEAGAGAAAAAAGGETPNKRQKKA